MTAQVQTMLRVPRSDAAQKLEKQISKGNELLSRTIASRGETDLFLRDKQAWSDYNAELLRSLFTTTDMRTEYIAVELAQESYVFLDQMDAAIDDVEEKLKVLHSIVQRLDLIPEEIISGDRATGASEESLNREVSILIRQIQDLRDAATEINPEAAEKAGRPGSGITELIKPYNSYLDKAEKMFSERDLQAVLAIKEIARQEEIRENLAASYHRKARQRILTGSGQLLRILEARVAPVDSFSRLRTGPFNRRVFIVHGHHEGKREAVARLLMQLDMEPVILHEQPSKGQTLIEKIEHNSDVGFAVVLLTGDDLGCMKGETDNLNPRARQNVVFELGYFFGFLGRKRVCALYESGVELPSDIQGLVYVQLDDQGGWKTSLAQELRAAGFDIDLAKLIA